MLPPVAIPTLAEIGIRKRESAAAQFLASLPEDTFTALSPFPQSTSTQRRHFCGHARHNTLPWTGHLCGTEVRPGSHADSPRRHTLTFGTTDTSSGPHRLQEPAYNSRRGKGQAR